MSDWVQIIILTLLAGIAMPVGAAIAGIERIRPRWLETEVRHRAALVFAARHTVVGDLPMRCMFRMKYTLLLMLAFVLAGCVARPVVEIKDENQHKEQSAQIISSIRKHGITGDWLVTRGYHATDTLVANATSSSISHVGVYNAETQAVIEAEGRGVHATPLTDFVNKSYRLLVIRPRWLTADNSQKAYSNADKLVGKKYDFLGTIGFNSPEKYYCSELAISIYEEWYRAVEKFPAVIKPSDLYLYGRILYDSQPRDEI